MTHSNRPLERGVLFTGFEPSGDDHASAVIAELRQRQPDLPIYAWGGPKMERAGATIVERTGESAVMGLPGVGKIIEHMGINRRARRWIRQGRASLHVPVDSPAANFPICRYSKRRGLRVMHLVAPQIWAWGRWRIRKLRRCTDRVLCLLPFEEGWFLARGVSARFVGHPLFDEPLDEDGLARRAEEIEREVEAISRSYRKGIGPRLRLGLMPGSRPSEIRACFPVLLDAYRRLQADFPDTTGVVAATTPEVASRLREIAQTTDHGGGGGWPRGLHVVIADTDAAIRWCDFALVVSGTVTLQIARQFKPMVAMYRPGWLVYQLLARWLVTTEHFTLPNLIAGRRIIPELIPHFGDGEALAVEVIKLLRRDGYADDQRVNLRAIASMFDGTNAARAAADEIERLLGLRATNSGTAPSVAAGLRNGRSVGAASAEGEQGQGAHAVSDPVDDRE
ncbi:MAG: hypothetical protein KF768_09540 [Phycisphaeraceae bacterium]|nr:hypothetical protein [Phycisphaeraceae bacterium]